MAIFKINSNWLNGSGFKANLERKFYAMGLHIETVAKDICPVDVGNLKGSIGHKVFWEDEKIIVTRIGTNVHYAWYIEFGTGKYAKKGVGRKTPWVYQDAKGEWHRTSGMKAQPFLYPALSYSKNSLKQLLRNA